MVSLLTAPLTGQLTHEPDPPAVPEENGIQKTLNAVGVKYSHRNDEVLLPSRVEEERSRNALLVDTLSFTSRRN